MRVRVPTPLTSRVGSVYLLLPDPARPSQALLLYVTSPSFHLDALIETNLTPFFRSLSRLRLPVHRRRPFSTSATVVVQPLCASTSSTTPCSFTVRRSHQKSSPELAKTPRLDEWYYIMSGLIEGLPDAVALRCLAWVPFYLHPNLELVSRSWRSAIRSPELFRARQELGASEDLLCICAFDPENLWQLYDPLRDHWITLPVLPSKIKNLAHFGAVSANGKLFVLGGGSDAVDPLTGDQDGSFASNEVWSYDPVARQWSPKASMLVPRAMFACCSINGKIVVAGGFTSCRKSISQAEMYDPNKDVWVPIPDLHRTHNSACTGVVIDGKLHVLHKGLSTVQVLDHVCLEWTVRDYGWLQGPMAVVQGSLYVMSQWVIVRQDGDTRKPIISASEFRRRIGCAMYGLGDDIYVIGGVTGPDRWNWDIKPLSDVDVLTVTSDRPAWRQVSPMTRCRGTILGCTKLTI